MPFSWWSVDVRKKKHGGFLKSFLRNVSFSLPSAGQSRQVRPTGRSTLSKETLGDGWVWYGLSLSMHFSRPLVQTCFHLPEHTNAHIHKRPSFTWWFACRSDQAGTLSSLTDCAVPQSPAKLKLSPSVCASVFVCPALRIHFSSYGRLFSEQPLIYLVHFWSFSMLKP